MIGPMKEGYDLHEYEDSALREAAENGHVEIVTKLLAHGANIHTGYDYALRRAAFNNHIETVRVLLAAGADPQANNNKARRLARQHGYTEMLALLSSETDPLHHGLRLPEETTPGIDALLRQAMDDQAHMVTRNAPGYPDRDYLPLPKP